MEKRKTTGQGFRPSEIPVEYAKMVSEVMAANFDIGLKKLEKIRGCAPSFSVDGGIFVDEIVLSITLNFKNQITATTVHASADFDPKASAPSAQDLLAACLDAAGGIFGDFLGSNDPAKLQQLASESMTAFEGAPFEWTLMELDRYRVYVKMDKTNPKLESLADEWLRKNDPELKRREKEEHEAAEALFITGKKKT